MRINHTLHLIILYNVLLQTLHKWANINLSILSWTNKPRSYSVCTAGMSYQLVSKHGYNLMVTGSITESCGAIFAHTRLWDQTATLTTTPGLENKALVYSKFDLRIKSSFCFAFRREDACLSWRFASSCQRPVYSKHANIHSPQTHTNMHAFHLRSKTTGQNITNYSNLVFKS